MRDFGKTISKPPSLRLTHKRKGETVMESVSTPVAVLRPLWQLPIPPETLTDNERSAALSQVILTTSVEVHA